MCKICNRILQVNNLAKSKLQYEVLVHDVISPERSLNQPKATRVCIYPFDKPMKWLYFRSFVVSVFFREFSFQGHTKIILFGLWLLSVLLLFLFFIQELA